uniref:ubiquitinyl hydrolase 1 n=1 Tax=Romanomermis culicivorax TaxID=13658 RepID=A0A915HZR2_ROMCU
MNININKISIIQHQQSFVFSVHIPKDTNGGDSNQNGLENGEDDGQEWQQVGPNKKAMVTRSSKLSSSPIANIFSGLLRNTVQPAASKVTANLESFFVLPLDIQADEVNSIPTALHKMHRETIKTTNKAKNEITILKRTTFQELPSVLILQLKYFVCNNEGNVKKLKKSIEYGIDLSIDRNMLTLANNTKLDRYSRSYKLFAVVYHHGDRIEKGHYTADIFHGGFWVNVDDTRITPVNESHILSLDFFKKVVFSSMLITCEILLIINDCVHICFLHIQNIKGRQKSVSAHLKSETHYGDAQ